MEGLYRDYVPLFPTKDQQEALNHKPFACLGGRQTQASNCTHVMVVFNV